MKIRFFLILLICHIHFIYSDDPTPKKQPVNDSNSSVKGNQETDANSSEDDTSSSQTKNTSENNSKNESVSNSDIKNQDTSEEEDIEDIDNITTSLKLKFETCCQMNFKDNSDKCATSFYNYLKRNRLSRSFRRLETTNGFSSELSELINGDRASELDEELNKKNYSAKDIKMIKTVLKKINDSITAGKEIENNFQKICKEHDSFLKLKPNFIDAEMYGIIMADSMFFYSNGFDNFIKDLINKTNSKEEMKCVVFNTSISWQKYYLLQDLSNLITHWETTDKNSLCKEDNKTNNKDMIDELLNNSIETTYSVTRCWLPDLLRLKQKYNPEKSIKEQDEEFHTVLQKCSDLPSLNYLEECLDAVKDIFIRDEEKKYTNASDTEKKPVEKHAETRDENFNRHDYGVKIYPSKRENHFYKGLSIYTILLPYILLTLFYLFGFVFYSLK